jgi:hypothetical protein
MRQAAMETDYCRAAFVCASDLRGQFGGQRVAIWPTRDLSALVIRLSHCAVQRIYIFTEVGAQGRQVFVCGILFFRPITTGADLIDKRDHISATREPLFILRCVARLQTVPRCVCIYVCANARAADKEIFDVCVGWELVKRGM